MHTQPLKWNRRQFQLILLGSLILSGDQNPIYASKPQQTESKILVEANNALALTLLRALDGSEKGENHFFSPFSLQSALSMAAEGASGETAVEMGTALQYPYAMRQSGEVPWEMTKMRNDFRMVSDRMRPGNSTKQVDHYELTNANSLWIDKSFKISTKYQSTITENYRPAAIIAADFRNKTDAERLRINQWVSEQTRGKIRDILPSGSITSLTRLVIANAIYFKGTWATPFSEKLTKSAPFTLRDQSKTSVPLMNMNNFKKGKYAAFNANGSVFNTPRSVDDKFDEQRGYPAKDGYQVAELPYNGDTLSMMIFLPTAANGLDTLLSTLTVTQIDTCAEMLDAREYQLSVPKFKLETTYDLIPPLRNLGMKQAFDAAQADFSGLSEASDPELYIGAVVHKAFVEVNEKGTEAAAATAVEMGVRSAMIGRPFVPRFVANRPFLFVIREKTSGLILFIGKVENPAA